MLEHTYWIDVCHSNGNLLVSGGQDKDVKVFDKRESRIVQTIGDIHARNNLLFAHHHRA